MIQLKGVKENWKSNKICQIRVSKRWNRKN